MKTFLIYLQNSRNSRLYARLALQSLQAHKGWQVQLLPGASPQDLKLWKSVYDMPVRPGSRAEGFKSADALVYSSKKSCFINHMRVWEMSVAMRQPVAFIEHDSMCHAAWINCEFEHVLILNARAAIRQSVVQKGINKNQEYYALDTWHGLRSGLHDWDPPLFYRFGNDSALPVMMPGTAAYAVTPQGAEILLREAQRGWEQSDHFINTGLVRIQYHDPGFFGFHSPNLQTSHGRHT